MTYQDAAAYYTRRPTESNRLAVLVLCQEGLLAEQRAPGSTPVREPIWQQRLLTWSARQRGTARPGQRELTGGGKEESV